MKRAIKLIVILGLLAGSIYLFNNQRRKLGTAESQTKKWKPKTYSLEELEQKREHIIKNIQDGI